MEAAGEAVSLPDCPAPFIVAQLLEIGPVVATTMGSAAISWRDLVAWQQCTGVPLSPWRARMLVELSREYLSFSSAAEKADCPAPWADQELTGSRRDTIARSLRINLRALMKGKGG
jgi:hypothetical protein